TSMRTDSREDIGFVVSPSLPALFFFPVSIAFSPSPWPDPVPNPHPPVPPMPGPPPPNNQRATSQPQITAPNKRTTRTDQRGGLRTIVARISSCARNPKPRPPPTPPPITARLLTTTSVVMAATLHRNQKGCHSPAPHRRTSDRTVRAA